MMRKELWFTGMLLLFFLLGPQFTAYANRGYSFLLACFASAILVGLFAWKSRHEITWNWGHLLLLGSLAALSVSSFRSDTDYLPWRSGLLYGSLLVVVWVVSQARYSLSYRGLLRAFAWVNVVFVACVFLSFLSGYELGGIDYYAGSGRLRFVFGNANYLAVVQLLFFGLFLGDLILVRPGPRADRLLAVFGLLSATVLLFFTGSRNGFIWWALCMGSGALIYLRQVDFSTMRQRLSFASVSAGVLALLTAWFLTFGSSQWTRFLELLDGPGSSGMGRLTIWQLSLALWRDSGASLFWGHGWGALYRESMSFPAEALSFQLQSVGFRHAHSEPLEILVEGGFVAFAFIAAFIFWGFRAMRSIKGGLPREAAALLFGLIFVAGFSLISVATRYAVFLLPTAITLGLLLRYLPAKNFRWSYMAWAFAFIIVGLNLFVSFRHFVSDVYLAKALAGPEHARGIQYERAVNWAPDRVAPRYEQLAFWSREAGKGEREKVEGAYQSLEETIPNFKNAGAFLASYYGSIAEFDAAGETLRSFSESRPFELIHLADACFYFWVAQEPAEYRQTLALLLYRAFLAETIGSGATVEHVAYEEASESIRVELPSSKFEVKLAQFDSRIPFDVRANQVILRYYILAELKRVMGKALQSDDKLRFTELLRSSDLDKVERLAAKLEELGR